VSDEQDILRALDLPDEAIAPFLAHVAAFCHAHGGERHYGELLAMLARFEAGSKPAPGAQ
jgi:hypothetical protein